MSQLTQESVFVVMRFERQKNESAQMIKRVVAVAEHVSYLLFVYVLIAELSFLILAMIIFLLTFAQSLSLQLIIEILLLIFCYLFRLLKLNALLFII
jgi:hypothetical protein